MENDNKVFASDFNVVQSDVNGQWMRIEELNKMLQYGVLSLDRIKMENYHADTRIIKC